MIISVFDRVENIVGKGEIACTSNFSFYHDVFERLLSQTRQKVSLCGTGLTSIFLVIFILSLAFFLIWTGLNCQRFISQRILTSADSRQVSTLPKGKILDRFELIAFVDDNLNVARMITSFIKFNRGENILGKEQNAGHKPFLLFQECFQKTFRSGSRKSPDENEIWKRNEGKGENSST